MALFFGVQLSYAQRIAVESIPRQPFLKYTKVSRNNRDTATFYLSESRTKTALPLLVYIQGSGNNSLFRKSSERIIPQAGQATFYDLSSDRYRVLIIEKPGVNYLQNELVNAKFDEQFSCQKWSASIVDVINTVLKRESVYAGKIMVVGHSEGGLVAAMVAAKLNKTVSHVAIMAGEGVSQLYSLYRFAEEGTYFGAPSFSKKQRIDSLKQIWMDILRFPDRTDKKFWGFTYLRWSSFLQTSVLEQLTAYRGNIFIIQGTADKNVYPESAKVLYADLLAKGKNVQLEMIDNANHSFAIERDDKINGWQMSIEKLVDWFLPKTTPP